MQQLNSNTQRAEDGQVPAEQAGALCLPAQGPAPDSRHAALTAMLREALQTDQLAAAYGALMRCLPQARLELAPGLCYLARRSPGVSDIVYAALLAGLADSPLRAEQRSPLCVMDFSLLKQQLVDVSSCNVIPAPAFDDRKYYHNLMPDGLPRHAVLSTAERGALFEAAAKLLEAGTSFFSIDHHYPYKALCTTCSTVLAVDFLDYLHATGRDGLLRELAHGWTVMDHCDADMLLAQFVRRSALDHDFRVRHGGLMKRAALFNDYGELHGSRAEREQARVLYFAMKGLESDINEGSIGVLQALELVPAAIELAMQSGATRDCDALFRELEADAAGPLCEQPCAARFMRGMRDFLQHCAVLEPMAARCSSGEVTACAGSICKDRSMLFAHIADDAPEVENFSFLLFLRRYHPEMLAGVDVIGSSSPIGPSQAGSRRPRSVHLRSVLRQDGTFVDLCSVVACLQHEDFGGRCSTAGGRPFAIGLARGPLPDLDVSQAAADLGEAVARVKAAAARQASR